MYIFCTLSHVCGSVFLHAAVLCVWSGGGLEPERGWTVHKDVNMPACTAYSCSGVPQSGGLKGFHVVKRVRVDALGERERAAALHEVEVLSLLEHPNVVKTCDSFLDDGGYLNIVYVMACQGVVSRK